MCVTQLVCLWLITLIVCTEATVAMVAVSDKMQPEPVLVADNG